MSLYTWLMFLKALDPGLVPLLALILGSAPVCLAQVRATTAGQESTFDGRYVTVSFHEDRGRQGLIRAPVELIDVDGAVLCADCAGGPFITLNCQRGADCFTGSVRYTGLTIGGGEVGAGGQGSATVDIFCSSLSECEAFLKALKESVTPKQDRITGRTGQDHQRRSGEETVIDGSRIPNQINFDKTQGSSKRSEIPPEPAKTAFEPLSSLFGPENSGPEKAPISGKEKLESLFESAGTQEPEREKIERRPHEFNLAEIAEKYGPGPFDEVRGGETKTTTDALRYVAGEWLKDGFQRLAENTTSYSFTGKSFDELPEAFRKDYAVWDKGLKRIFEPFSLKGGLELVEAFGSLLDLWGER